jgi:1-acyl-sn-glycerol-3-phosphate acyltransferase
VLRRAARLSRQLRTGLAFLYYGAIVAFVSLLLPVQRLLHGTDQIRAQRSIHRALRSFVRVMQGLGLVRIRRIGFETLAASPLLVVANHPSTIDGPLLGSFLPQVDLVVKHVRHPVNIGIVGAAGYLPMEPGPALVEQAVARLRAGRRVLMFPEGTRSPVEGLGAFHRGAAHVALRSGFDLLPVVVQLSPRSLMKGQPWYDVADRAIDITLRVLPPVSPAKLLSGGESEGVAARKLTAALRRRYVEALEETRGVD